MDRATGQPMRPTLRMAARSGPGVVFELTLLLVLFITNVPIRGLASVVAILAIFLLVLVLTIFEAWEPILEALVHSRIHINALGYSAIAVPLFVVWLVFMLFIARGMKVAMLADDGFSKLLAAGLTFSFALQTFIIVGGILRMIPLTGVTLPFVSYGGSSVVANFVLLAGLLLISNRSNSVDR